MDAEIDTKANAPEDTADSERRERLTLALDKVRREFRSLPDPGRFSIVAASTVAVVFGAGAVLAAAGMVREGADALAAGGFRQVLGLLFFLMSVLLSGRIGVKRIRIRRRRRKLTRAEAELVAMLEKEGSHPG